jgi:hypothetical protein
MNRYVFVLLLAFLMSFSALSHAQSIVISEFMADNGGSILTEGSCLDEDNDSSDWIELYNLSDSAVSLDGWYLTDDAADLTQWSFPAVTIPAKGFLIVFASGKNRSVAGSELHTNFKLSASGEYIALVQPDGSTIEHSVVFPAQETDVSYGCAFVADGVPTVVLDAAAPSTAHIPTGAGDAAGWQESGFNDAGWLSGITGIGYDDSPGGTYNFNSLVGLNVLAMKDVNATVYIRVPFTLTDAGSVTGLKLKMKYDDAFVAYINGAQVLASAHVPGTLSWNSGATGLHDDAEAVVYEEFDLSASLGILQEGDNLLAIHGLNYGISSSDLLFVPRLEAYTSGIDISECGLFTVPTPGGANANIDYDGLVETPVTYPGRGFYDAPVLVSVSNVTAGATIRYTLDGSEPTESSALYSGPMTISSTANLRVRAFLDGWKPSHPRTDTYLFVDDVILQPEYSETIVGDYASDGGQSMIYGMNQAVVNDIHTDASNQTFSVQDALKAIPSISITTDHDHLFSPSSGIYVNASQHWERPASAELIYPDGSKGFHINAGLRVRGGWSRHDNYPKHAFRLFFRNEYGEGKLKYALFEDEGVKAFDKIDLRTSQNYNWVAPWDDRTKNNFIRDIVCRDASGAMGTTYARSRYYHLYLNGQYWGLYMTEERPEANYAASYLGGDPADYDTIKVSNWTKYPSYQIEATDGTTEAYTRLFNASMNGFADNADYFSVQGLDANGQPDPTKEKLLDLKNMIDYVLLIFYSGASDNSISQFGNNSGINNIYAVYNRANPDGFKWIQHDCEHALDTSTSLDRTGPFPAEVFDTPQYFNAQTLHDRLSANAEYRLAFADRVYKHFENGGALVHTNMEALVDFRAAQIDRAIVANAARWGDTNLDRDTWVNAVATTRAWFNGRAQTVIGYLDADGLIPSIPPPQISRSSGPVAEGTTVSMSEVEVTEPPSLSTPYYGNPMAIPGIIETEDYDLGGPGIAYQDTDAGNNGGAYRTSEDVDVEDCSEGGYDIGYAAAGEWVKYTVDVAAEGDYEMTARVARGTEGAGAFHIEVDGIDVTGSISVEDTGGWQNWADKTSNVTLADGEQVVKLVIETGGFNINRLDFTFVAPNTVPGVTNFPTTIYYTTDGTDPRAIGGGIVGSVYSSAITITEPTHIKARARNTNGEWSALAEATFWTPDIPLAVTEIMYHAPAGNPHDYIEVRNVSDEAVTLKGYKLDNAIDFKFKNGPVSLGSGEYMVIVDDVDAFSSSYPTNGIIIGGEFSGDFSNGGEKVDLEFRNNDLISFSYSDARNWPQAADGAGHSLVPLDSAMDDQERGSLDYGGNWRASTYIGGSPGYADPPADESVVLNEIIAHTDTGLDPPYDSNDKIELYNPTASAITISGWHLSDDLDNLTKFAIPNGTTIPAFGFVVFDEDDFHPGRTNGFGLSKAGEQVILSTAGRVVDAIRFKGQENGVSYGRYPDGAVDWVTTLTTPGSANQPVNATVCISELMYNPLQPGNDYEYIQLENVGTAAHLFENSTGTYRIDGGVEFDFPPDISLAAGERLWILSFNPTNTAKLNLFCSAYGLNTANETFLGGYKDELSDRGERVALERPQDSDDPLRPLDISWVVIDELFYFDQAPWTDHADGTGNPLVRMGLTSWGVPSATDTDGDQMPDAWEMAHFGSLEQIVPDWDGDGFTDLEEYIADTDPTDPLSVFIIEDMVVPTLYWTAASGRTYSVYWTESLQLPFIRIASGLTSGSYTDDLHSGGNANYYRIQVEMD